MFGTGLAAGLYVCTAAVPDTPPCILIGYDGIFKVLVGGGAVVDGAAKKCETSASR